MFKELFYSPFSIPQKLELYQAGLARMLFNDLLSPRHVSSGLGALKSLGANPITYEEEMMPP